MLRGRDERKAEQIESVSAPLYNRWGFHAELSSRSLFTILPLWLSEKQLFSEAVTALF